MRLLLQPKYRIFATIHIICNVYPHMMFFSLSSAIMDAFQ